ncbi:TetR/AcrR family transcriptional regulator [Pseudoruegeria sp. HB172150]|uniref:TetR/AcrR family transcriptional regulator n=1 Tax=Pseudoruegeria sp. HB172150 TaxID=2721164 RepID=UPI001556B0C1|nr:TetR/AcrR family transcriptional regulator [Pseudoruegeria sp. HB172150]
MQTSQAKRPARGGRPTKRESERIAADIVDAARHLFVTQGFSATTMEQVIARCGIGKDTLYRRFATKEDLFAAVTEMALARTIDWLEAAEAESPSQPLDRVRHLARWFLDANLDPQLLALKREAFIEAMRARPLAGEDPFTPRLAKAIAEADAKRQLHAPDPKFMASQLIAAVVLGPSNSALMGDMALEDSEARDAWFEKAWALFVEGAGVGETSKQSDRANQ